MTHPETEPAKPLSEGPARRINVTFGSELPTLVHHSFHDHRGHFGRFRPVGVRPFMNKPSGGLLAYPAASRPGVWRPWPHRSVWTEWCEAEEMDSWINDQMQAKLFPRRAAVFAVINSGADARALADAFPADEEPQFALEKSAMLKGGAPGDLFALHIDWPRLREHGLSGVYLTARGERLTRFPEKGVPPLYGWDMPTVWFCQPHYHLGTPWRSRRLAAH